MKKTIISLVLLAMAFTVTAENNQDLPESTGFSLEKSRDQGFVLILPAALSRGKPIAVTDKEIVRDDYGEPSAVRLGSARAVELNYIGWPLKASSVEIELGRAGRLSAGKVSARFRDLSLSFEGVSFEADGALSSVRHDERRQSFSFLGQKFEITLAHLDEEGIEVEGLLSLPPALSINKLYFDQILLHPDDTLETIEGIEHFEMFEEGVSLAFEDIRMISDLSKGQPGVDDELSAGWYEFSFTQGPLQGKKFGSSDGAYLSTTGLRFAHADDLDIFGLSIRDIQCKLLDDRLLVWGDTGLPEIPELGSLSNRLLDGYAVIEIDRGSGNFRLRREIREYDLRITPVQNSKRCVYVDSHAYSFDFVNGQWVFTFFNVKVNTFDYVANTSKEELFDHAEVRPKKGGGIEIRYEREAFK